MIIRALSSLVLASLLMGCSAGETENTLPPDPNAQPKAIPPAKKKGTKPLHAPSSNQVPIR